MTEHEQLVVAVQAIRDVAKRTGMSVSDVIEIAKVMIQDEPTGVHVIGQVEINYVTSYGN